MATVGDALMMTYVIGFGWMMVLPLFAAQRGWTQIPGLSVEGWISVIFLGLACSGLAYVFWYDALLEAGASQVASFLYLEPIVTVVVAATWIGERGDMGHADRRRHHLAGRVAGEPARRDKRGITT